MNLVIRCEKCGTENGSKTACHMVVHSGVFTEERDFKYCPVDRSDAQWEEIKDKNEI